jgi:hypothetical protein
MAVVTVELTAFMADGKALEVVADQRDFARWETMPNQDSTFIKLRFMAWSSAYRAQLYKGSFAEWNEQDCVEVVAAAGDDEEVDGLDPGRPAASAAGSSS